MFRKLLAVLMALMVVLTGTIPVFAASDDDHAAGAVYVLTNATTGNQVIAYSRGSDGTLAYVGSFDTGGLGSGVGVTVPPDPLGSQNGLLISPNGKWLFAVNAGSNSISVFKVKSYGLKLTDTVSSQGSYPVSLTYHDEILYVLNAGEQGSISGFQLDDEEGELKAIKDSTRSLQANTPADGSQPQILESPAQVSFSPDGQFLVITDKGGVSGTGRILVFSVSEKGRPSADFISTNTSGPVPFSFTFDSYGHLIVVDPGVNSVASYAIEADGSLSTLSTLFTGQAATCWIAFNGQYLFTDNTGSSTVSAISSAADGSLTLLNAVAANTGAGTLPLDMGISRDGQFLYSLETGAGSVGAFRINADGSLDAIGTFGSFGSVNGTQGIAVR